MAETWMTYRQLANHWQTTPEAARARSRRGNYQRRTNNVGATEILVDTDAPVPEGRQKAQDGQTRSATPPNTPDAEAPPQAALEALEGHIATLKEQLAKAEATTAAERERVADLTAQLLKITADLLEARKAEAAPRSWWARLVG
jgi:hypothetical protein